MSGTTRKYLLPGMATSPPAMGPGILSAITLHANRSQIMTRGTV